MSGWRVDRSNEKSVREGRGASSGCGAGSARGGNGLGERHGGSGGVRPAGFRGEQGKGVHTAREKGVPQHEHNRVRRTPPIACTAYLVHVFMCACVHVCVSVCACVFRYVNGRHYSRTLEDWLVRHDRNSREVRELESLRGAGGDSKSEGLVPGVGVCGIMGWREA